MCESLILYFYYLFIYLFIFFFCSEYVKIFGGNGTIQFYKTGCWASSQTDSLFEVPFGKSSNITVNILLTKLNSLVNVQFVVLKTGLHSGTYIVHLNCADFLKRKKKNYCLTCEYGGIKVAQQRRKGKRLAYFFKLK